MDFSKNKIEKELNKSRSKSNKIFNKFILIVLKAIFVCVVLCAVFGVAVGIGALKGIIDNTPEVSVESIVPLGYATNVYDSEGNHTDTLVTAGSNREEASFDELPADLINAFVAIEDSRFWEHNGIDTKSILRAAVGLLTGDSSAGGGSTLTQQLIKNNVFNGGGETSLGAKLERKIQEQYLAVMLEKTMDKKLIITNYLNTINLGSNTLGVKVAARRYFNKDLSELTLSECAVIAGITQNPSKYNPIRHPENNAEKRTVILQYMYEQGYITKAQQEEALADDVYDRIQNVDLITQAEVDSSYSYFTDELINQVMETFVGELGYTETQAHNMLYSGGLTIITTQDPKLQSIVDEEINNPDNYPSTAYSVEYRLSIKKADGETENYSDKDIDQWHKDAGDSSYNGLYPDEDAARADCQTFKELVFNEENGDELLGERIITVMQPQASFVLMDQYNGQVKAISGGRGNKGASLTLNRASDSLRQPGSTFKVITAFAPAVDACGASLGTVYYDAPYSIGSKTFRNWYTSGYNGWSSIRDGIACSMNIVAIRCFMETVTPQLGIEYAMRMGITSLTENDYNPATALGGIWYGVSNLELTAAYASIANRGIYTKPSFFTRIYDHDGRLLIDNEPKTTRVMKESTAFLMTSAMEDVVNSYSTFGGSINSTSPAARLDNITTAGKSGTTSSSLDLWFEGFTPYYTAGIWSGYDNNESTLSGTSSFHKQLWKKIMDRVHEGLSDKSFPVPENIETAQICRKSGKLAIPGVCELDPRGNAVYTEYFEAGTVPTEFCDHHTTRNICMESLQQAGIYCPITQNIVATVIPEDELDITNDTNFAALIPCQLHAVFDPNLIYPENPVTTIISDPYDDEPYPFRQDADEQGTRSSRTGEDGPGSHSSRTGVVEPGPGDRNGPGD